MSDNPQFNALK